MNITPGHYCRECKFFLYPEPSKIYRDTMTRYCPHSCHRWETGGYALGGMQACASFERADQGTLVMAPGAVEISRRTSRKTTPPVSLPREVILGGKTPSKNETKWKD